MNILMKFLIDWRHCHRMVKMLCYRSTNPVISLIHVTPFTDCQQVREEIANEFPNSNGYSLEVWDNYKY